MTSTRTIKRATSESYDHAKAYAHPLDAFSLFGSMLPLPHLESFLDVVDAYNPDLISTEFVASLFSVSVESLPVNGQQVVYARMLAHGFALNPDTFNESVKFLSDGSDHSLTKSVTIGEISTLNVSWSLAVDLFGVDPAVAQLMMGCDVDASASIIRLIQTGVITQESMMLAYNRHVIRGFSASSVVTVNALKSRTISTELDDFFVSTDSDLTHLAMLQLDCNDNLTVELIQSGVELSEITSALNTTSADVATIVKSKIQGIDSTLLSSLLG
jgi:hypothetical protein